MNYYFRELYNLFIFLIITLLILRMFPFIYIGSYSLINKVDSTIYARYSTSDKFDENVFYNTEVIKEAGILDQFIDNTDEDDILIQHFAHIIYDNKDEIREVISNNAYYQDYLVNIGSSVDELIEWSEKISLLDSRIMMASLYLTFLIITLVMVVIFKYRKSFYICAGVVYIIAILSEFTDGISDYIVVNVASAIGMLAQNEYIYEDIEGWRIIFNQAFKESTLTFIILDTVIQILLNNYKERIEKAIRYLYTSLEIQCSYLSLFENSTYKYIAKLKIANNKIIKICNKQIRKNCKIINKKMTSTEIKNNLKRQNDRLSMLKRLLQNCCCNSNEYTTKEYILQLREIQCLMYQCNLVQE